jgi:hypothetical protein
LHAYICELATKGARSILYGTEGTVREAKACFAKQHGLDLDACNIDDMDHRKRSQAKMRITLITLLLRQAAAATGDAAKAALPDALREIAESRDGEALIEAWQKRASKPEHPTALALLRYRSLARWSQLACARAPPRSSDAAIAHG